MTTICAIHTKNGSAIAGDGQVTLGKSVIMKASAQKVRRIYNDQVLIGFAGGVADAISLEEMFTGKLTEFKGNLRRAAIEMARSWRKDPTLQKLEAMLIVMDAKDLLLVSGTGEVLTPDDGILTVGSGGNYALAAARALKDSGKSAEEIARTSLEIASSIDIFTNDQIVVEKIGG
ncbi:ATP-dependent protease subunit HslV [Atopobacter sp. AH10]|uniref:ATP-dependent protease subunit HslV n=1 Tax=Atopobacter sp. AH10 TaxID=2315861 RepID=UPI000EF19BD6|nr:ATP-dependent protease subunit HslV [Atopobacter sp. AH10]RLK63389.1 ATP-dependent protease subunit HslV [Atopobacter sp. AH10]